MDIHRALAVKHRAVTTVLWELTHACPWKCAHCYLGNKPPAEDLTFAEVERVLDQLARAGVLWLTISGGEPTLQPRFFQILDRTKHYGFYVELFSNLQVGEEQVDELTKYNLESVEATLLGPNAELHDALSKAPGSFDRLTANARRLVERGTRVTIKTVLTSENLEVRPQIEAIAERIGCSYKETWEICNRVDTKNTPTYGAISQQQWIEHVRKEKVENPPLEPVMRTEMDTHYCGAGEFSWTIDPRGNVYPCVVFRLSAGNLLEQTWEEIYDSQTMRMVRDTAFDVPEACGGCTLQPYCKRCKGQAWMESGDPATKSRLSCLNATMLREMIVGGEPKIGTEKNRATGIQNEKGR